MKVGDNIYLVEMNDRWRFIDKSTGVMSIKTYGTQQEGMHAWYDHDVEFTDLEKGQGDDIPTSDTEITENENP